MTSYLVILIQNLNNIYQLDTLLPHFRWKAEDLFVRLGEYDFQRTNDSRSYNFKVIDIRQHELFDMANYRHDIAILKLHRPTIFNTYVWPICLPPRGLELENEIATVIGAYPQNL